MTDTRWNNLLIRHLFTIDANNNSKLLTKEPLEDIDIVDGPQDLTTIE